MDTISGSEEPTPILLTDDDPAQRLLLQILLEQKGFFVHTAANGREALDILERDPAIRLLVTDLEMPEMDGFALIKALRQRHGRYVYIIVLTSMEEQKLVVKALRLGADDFMTKPAFKEELELRIKGGQRLLHLESQDELILALAKLSEYRSDETGYHLERVQWYTRLLARDLADNCHESTISAIQAEEIAQVSPLHDIGKVAIADDILHKPGKLTREEFATIKTHTIIGGNILQDIYRKNGSAYLKTAWEIARHHHERFDGSGYPDGLSGNAIPLAARIMALADVYDALASKRCYKDPFPHEKIRAIILQEKGHHFDPLVVDAFLRQEDIWLTIRERFQDGNAVPA